MPIDAQLPRNPLHRVDYFLRQAEEVLLSSTSDEIPEKMYVIAGYVEDAYRALTSVTGLAKIEASWKSARDSYLARRNEIGNILDENGALSVAHPVFNWDPR